ncbi:uncharacterized protein LOC116338386 [Contarinia nasturtii]|uniref:uncharacterized protein LOC116338386 n=1 Tax=Contarinia nasturtii TaxID=265458 RepID=UPI0012D37AC8|nr:uncharacterized protein LOC116338386 [Contarinia nasturtii]
MLTFWLILTFGFLSQTKTMAAETIHAAIVASTSPTVHIDSSDANGDLESAETKDPKKQIRRVNSDGSFVIGYETVDGTFKIESRDLLGNVKGTYGYLDENGEIKRVSYIANNTTNGLKRTSQPIKIPNKSGISSSSTTQRPITYQGSATQSIRSHSNIIQPLRKQSYSSSHRRIDHTIKLQKSEPSTLVYATSVQSTNIPSTISSNPEPTSQLKEEDFTKESKMNKSYKFSNVSNGKSERKQIQGNLLRRQLPNDQSENFETKPQIIYGQSSDEDLTGTQRPLFSTTNSPRIPAIVIAARERQRDLRDRVSILKNMKNIVLQPTPTNEKPIQFRTKTDDNLENEYFTQSPVPVQIPTTREIVQKEKIVKYRNPISHFMKTSKSSSELENASGPKQYKLPVSTKLLQREVESEQYLRETSASNAKDSSLEQYTNSNENAATHPFSQSINPYSQISRTVDDQRPQQQFSFPMQPYQALSPQLSNYIERPLTARDFERLLNILAIRFQQHQHIGYSQDVFTNGLNGFRNYYSGYNPYQIFRSPLYNQFDPRYTAFSRTLPPLPPPPWAPYSEQENMYQAQNPKQYYSTGYDRTDANDLSNQKFSNQNGDYLPSNVREELLYRMLMLAIQPDFTPSIPFSDASTIHEYFKSKMLSSSTPLSDTNSKKPVRSVQILGDE